MSQEYAHLVDQIHRAMQTGMRDHYEQQARAVMGPSLLVGHVDEFNQFAALTEPSYPQVIAAHIKRIMARDNAARDVILVRMLASNPWWLHTVAQRSGWRRLKACQSRDAAETT